jgi:Transcriptional regulator LmrA/YxaF-like, C-terminal domain
VLLLHLPDGRNARAVDEAMRQAVASLPDELFRSITWDQGKEMSGHAAFSVDRLRAVAARCFDEWEALIAARLRADGWPDGSAPEAASAALALVEGALLLGRVSGQLSHLVHAKRAALALLATPLADDGTRLRTF